MSKKYAYMINVDGSVTARTTKIGENPSQVINKLIARASRERREGISIPKENSK